MDQFLNFFGDFLDQLVVRIGMPDLELRNQSYIVLFEFWSCAIRQAESDPSSAVVRLNATPGTRARNLST